MLDRVLKVFLTTAVAAGIAMIVLPGQGQGGQAPAAQPAQKNWKDRAEYDLYNAIVKEQDASKRLALLNSWKEKYSTSDYADARSQIYVTTYAALNQPDKVIATGNEVLQSDPKNLTVLYMMALNVLGITKPTPDDLASGEKAANGLISNIDTFFDFTKSLQSTPNNAQVSYWLGTAIVQEKKPEKQPVALFHFARAASLDQSQGGFNAQAKQSIETYFVNAYNRFHGQDAAELSKLRDLAKASPFPPDGFTIKDINEIKAANEEKFRKENPGLALWMTLKQALTAADGQQYFDANMKGAAVPGGAGGVQTFKGKLISTKPALRPKELVLSIGDGTTPDATLMLDAALPGKAEPGVEIEFAGVPSAFTKEPYNVTFDVEKKKVTGWPGKEAAPVRHHTGAKKASKKG